MSVSTEVQYESRVRLRYGVVAFAAAIFLVGSQLLELSGPQASVQETTLNLIAASQRQTLDVVGAFGYMLGLLLLGVVLNWVYRVSRARNPGMVPVVRWITVSGASLAAVMAFIFTLRLLSEAHQFVTTGNQSYPEAQSLTGGTANDVIGLLVDLGLLLLAMGCIWTCLNAIRVGLVTRLVGYTGVASGAFFIFPVLGVFGLLVQVYWLAALAITLAARWPSGDPPAWASGNAVPWPSNRNVPGAQELRSRPTRAQRRKVSTQDVMAAVEPRNGNGGSENGPSPSASSGKRKRKRK